MFVGVLTENFTVLARYIDVRMISWTSSNCATGGKSDISFILVPTSSRLMYFYELFTQFVQTQRALV